MKFEHHHQPLAHPRVFRHRLLMSILTGLSLIVGSLILGTAGYHWIVKLKWIDSFLNASMILSGMGPLDRPESDGGKIFAGLYALASGFAIIFMAGIMFSPLIHRFLHRFHMDEDETTETQKKKKG